MLCYDSTTYELREIPDQQIAVWRETGNPKLAHFPPAPPKTSEDAVWSQGEWIVPVAATPESVSARQIRLWLVTKGGITMAQVDAAIDTIPDQTLREATRVEWEYGTEVHRDHAMVNSLAAALGLDDAAVNQAFREAAVL